MSPPKSDEKIAANITRKKSARGSVFTVAAAEIIKQNPDLFKLELVEEDQSAASAHVEKTTLHSVEDASESIDNELDWSPGSEFVKFASITTLPSLKIPETPAITDEYLATLADYKTEFIAGIFSASSNRNRSR